MQFATRRGLLARARHLGLISLLALTGCFGDGGGGLPPATAPLQSIEITPANPSIAAGTSTQLAATAIYADQSHADVTAQVAWASSASDVASVGASTGLAGGAKPGTATLSATLGDVHATTTMAVTAARVLSIAITPSMPALAAGTNQQFVATGTFTDNTTQDLSADMSWSSADTTIATVNSAGLASTLSVGQTTISAQCNVTDTCAGMSTTVALKVSAATLVSLAVTPASPNIALGTTEPFVATGTYSDHTTQNLTAAVTWTSSATAAASISNTAGSNGLATALAVGATNITATLGPVSSAAVPLNVTAAVLVSIDVTPANPSIAAGLTQSFVATGTYGDHTTQNLTTQVTWASSASAVATISNASGSNGLANGLAAGASNITATLGPVSSPAVALNVTAATLVSIAVTPASPGLALGLTQQFVATGTYTDHSTHLLTAQATWASSASAVAPISNAAGSNGLATAATIGATNITATVGLVTSTVVPLNVTAATLVTIAVTPSSPSITLGLTQQFIATGTYTDNTTHVLTTQATWASSATGVATISNAAGSNGLASASTVGATNITATLGSVTSTAVPLNVTAATLVSIAVTPGNVSLANGTTQQYTAIGTYSDASTLDITGTVTWSSSTSSVATISNAAGSKGLATVVANAATTISATLGGITGFTGLAVHPMSFDVPGAFTWTVPAGVTSIQVVAVGAGGGGSSSSTGGNGGSVTVTLSVTPGQILALTVGGAGTYDHLAEGSGGGSSDVNAGTANQIIAGGGGGAGDRGAGGDGGTDLFGGIGSDGIDIVDSSAIGEGGGLGIGGQSILSGQSGGSGNGGVGGSTPLAPGGSGNGINSGYGGNAIFANAGGGGGGGFGGGGSGNVGFSNFGGGGGGGGGSVGPGGSVLSATTNGALPQSDGQPGSIVITILP
jgi:hypothetical protein